MSKELACYNPPALTEEQLLDYLEDKNSIEISQHLEKCAYCSHRLKQLQGFDDHLASVLHRFDCYDPQTLMDYALGRLATPQRRLVEAHLKICRTCSDEINTLVTFLETEVPEEFLEVQPSRPIPHQPSATEYIASISLGASASALRGKMRGPTVFTAAEGLDIILEHYQSAGRSRLMGQVLADDLSQWEGALIQVHDHTKLLASTTVDGLGAFECNIDTAIELTIRILSPSGSAITIADIRFDE